MPAIGIGNFYRILQFNCCKADMTKVEVYCHKRLMVLFVCCFIFPMSLLAQFNLHIHPVDKDSTFITGKLKLQTNFKNWLLCAAYIAKLPALLQSKGYSGASVDSVRYDSM